MPSRGASCSTSSARPRRRTRSSRDDARWQPAQPWWGGAAAGPDAEIDVVAAHRDDRTRVLVGEVKLSLDAADVPRLLHDLEAKARACDWACNKQLTLRLWTLRWRGRARRPPAVIGASELQATWREATGREVGGMRRA